MIVRMKRLTVLCVQSARDETLNALRDLGVLHLAPIVPPVGDDLENAREYLNHVQRALEVLPRGIPAKPSGRPADEIVSDIWELIHARKEEEQSLDLMRHEQKRLAPYGSFDPASVAELAEKGIVIKLYHAPVKQVVAVPEGCAYSELSRDKSSVYFAVVGRGEFQIDAQELRMPEKSLAEVERRIAESEKRMGEIARSLEVHAGDYAVVSKVVDEAEERVRYLEAKSGMGEAAAVAYLRGYCPVYAVEGVRKAAVEHGWGLIEDDPPAGEAVPTLIKNPAWVQPIKAVFSLIGVVPGYEEVDISAVFLLFLSLFFSILVGDAGYGALFLGLTLFARRKMPKAPGYPFTLLIIMSVGTIIWGVITGTYFGIENLPAPLRQVQIAWLADESNFMLMCFFIGAIHLTIAHLWNVSRTINSLRALAQVGWICMTWTMFFMARNLVLQQPLPWFIGLLFLAGLVLVALFMTPPREFKTEWFNHAMLPLTIISNFVDVVSYLRLFAVGTATFAVASAFNSMAAEMGHGIVGGLLAAFILFVGHTLNILLAGMGVLVHGVRLNTLEFSSHIGMQWTGQPYNPFRRKTREEAV